MWLLCCEVARFTSRAGARALGRLRSRTFIGRFLAVADSDVINTRAGALYYTTAAQNVIFCFFSLGFPGSSLLYNLLFYPGGVTAQNEMRGGMQLIGR